MLLKPVQVEYYQNRAAQMCSFLTEIKFCCGHRHSGSHWLTSFPLSWSCKLTKNKIQTRAAYMKGKISSQACPVPNPRIPSMSHRSTMLRHAFLVCKFELQWILLGGHMEYSASPESVTVRLTNDSFGIVRGQRTQTNTVYSVFNSK